MTHQQFSLSIGHDDLKHKALTVRSLDLSHWLHLTQEVDTDILNVGKSICFLE